MTLSLEQRIEMMTDRLERLENHARNLYRASTDLWTPDGRSIERARWDMLQYLNDRISRLTNRIANRKRKRAIQNFAAKLALGPKQDLPDGVIAEVEDCQFLRKRYFFVAPIKLDAFDFSASWRKPSPGIMCMIQHCIGARVVRVTASPGGMFRFDFPLDAAPQANVGDGVWVWFVSEKQR